MDYSTWPVKTLSILSLRLDPNNPRLANISKPTQKELIEELLEHEDVLSLARDISKSGYFPNELLVATKENGVIVVEGNRRLAALKLLANPELAPAKYVKRITHLSQHATSLVKKVLVVIAPSRDEAIPLMMARHTGYAVRGWTTVMQARFVLSRIDSGKTVDEVSQETGLDRTEIQNRIRDAKLYDVVQSLSLPDKIQEIVHDPRKFPFTNLQRLVESASVRRALGMSTNTTHGFTTSLVTDDFQTLLTKMVTDVATDKVNSRSHNTADAIDDYVKELTKTGKPKIKRGEPTPASELVDPSKSQPIPEKKTKEISKPSKLPASVGLIPTSFRVDIDDDRILAIVAELKSMRLSKYPNAAAITYRSLLDMAVTRYLQESGELKNVIAGLSKKQTRPADWLPSLNQQLNYILNTPSVPLGPEGRKALQHFVSNAQQALTLDALNWFTHVRYIPPTELQLRSFWTMLMPLIELTLHQKT